MKIILKNITKKFGNKIILNEFSQTINNNDYVIIYGKSGSGKSTLLNILGRIDKDFEGILEYYENDNLLKVKDEIFRRNHLNYIFQNFALIDNETVKENLNIVLENQRKTKKQKIEMMENVLKEVDLEEVLNEKIYKLSGGEQQRVAFARCLLKTGSLVIADEPTGNLDDENKKSIMNLLRKLHDQNKTIIVVTHDESFKKEGNKVINI